MKVYWIVSNYPHPHNVQAGIFYKDFAEGLAKAGIDITVIAPVPFAGPLLSAVSSKWKTYRLSPFYEEQHGVKIYRPRYFTHPGEVYNGIPHYFMLRAIKKLKLPRPDVVHGFGGYPSAYAAVNLFGQETVHVSTFTGSDVNEYPHVNAKSLERFKYIVTHSQQTIGVSKDLSEKIGKLTGINAVTIHIPFSMRHLQAGEKPQLRKKFGIDPSKFIVLFAGYLYETKGVNELCDALEHLAGDKTIQALFCGGSSPLVKRVEALAAATYLGQLPREKVLEYMTAADVLVLPSYAEGIPGVIKEAAFCNLPVIATNVGGIPELISEETGWLIKPKSSGEILKTILEVKNNYSVAMEKGAKLRKLVVEDFEVEQVVERQVKLYESLVHKKE